MKRLGVYIHVPFCATRCRYCDFYRVGDEATRRARFFSALKTEIREREEWRGYTVQTVYFGGGTPSRAELQELAETLEELRKAVSLAPDCEITLEANPSDVDPSRAEGWRQLGIERVSLGVQSFVERELALLGRRHRAAEAYAAVETLRAAGFQNLNLDLMIGIPAQTGASFRSSVEEALRLEPEHLSAYLLEVHRNTEFDVWLRTRPRLFAGEEAVRRRYLWLRQAMLEAGYEHYEISNFARKGRRSRHNLTYWTGGDWIGLGPAAHSAVGKRRFAHPSDLRRYLENPIAVEELPADREEERIFLGLRLKEGVSAQALEEAGWELQKVSRWAEARSRWVSWNGERLSLEVEGWLVMNFLLGELLSRRGVVDAGSLAREAPRTPVSRAKGGLPWGSLTSAPIP